MEDQGAQEAMAKYTVQVAMVDRGAQEAMAKYTVQEGAREAQAQEGAREVPALEGTLEDTQALEDAMEEAQALEGALEDWTGPVEPWESSTGGDEGESNPDWSTMSLWHIWLAIFSSVNPERRAVDGVRELAAPRVCERAMARVRESAAAGVRDRATAEVCERTTGSGLRMREELWRTGVSEGGPEGVSLLEQHMEDASWW
ncbi:hypothetical protein M9458_052141 [Cirrhinus mrigala]|uniref:Uncharacterized protein n=1 Tax=Cirrhinus mrigala TaxID=683832 RepID=A0ABD0MWG0_CIRMR